MRMYAAHPGCHRARSAGLYVPSCDEQFIGEGRLLPNLELFSVSWGTRITLHELMGQHILLLAGHEGGRWCDAGRVAASRLGIPLVAHAVGDGADLLDRSEQFYGAIGITRFGAALITQEGYLRWRSPYLGCDPEATLSRALTRLQTLVGHDA